MRRSILLAIWQFFSRLFVMAVVPLLAWGWDDLPEFFANPARLSYVMLIAIQAMFFAWFVYRTPHEINQDSEEVKFHWYIDLFELIFILAAYGDRRSVLTWGENSLSRWVGFSIYLLGAGFSIWANQTWVNYLCREKDRALENATMINEGPYRWVRYPSMLAILFYGLGTTFVFRSWIGLVLIIPLCGAIFYQISNMEEAYAKQYQRAWGKRCQSSKRVLPFIY